MKKGEFMDTQIVSILNQQESGMAVKEICREHGDCFNRIISPM